MAIMFSSTTTDVLTPCQCQFHPCQAEDVRVRPNKDIIKNVPSADGNGCQHHRVLVRCAATAANAGGQQCSEVEVVLDRAMPLGTYSVWCRLFSCSREATVPIQTLNRRFKRAITSRTFAPLLYAFETAPGVSLPKPRSSLLVVVNQATSRT